MDLKEIILEIPGSNAEELADALINSGAQSVSFENAFENSEKIKSICKKDESAVDNFPWINNRISIIMNYSEDHIEIIKKAFKLTGVTEVLPLKINSLKEKDWIKHSQNQFPPIKVGKEILVVATWHKNVNPKKITIQLNPGLAFGTGSHPSTKLCMEWIEVHSKHISMMLDYGCGSGILSILGSKLGISKVVGIDIDPKAIYSSYENCKINNCLAEFYLPEKFFENYKLLKFPLVVANILSNPLKLMEPILSNRISDGGFLLLSGILYKQASEIISYYSSKISLSIWREYDGWVALSGQIKH